MQSQIYQTKPTKPNLPNQTYQTKSTKPNILNQTKPTKLVKAVNGWVRSAFGNVSFYIIWRNSQPFATTKKWTKSYEVYPSKMLLHNSMTKKITIIVGAATLCWFLFHLIWPTYNNINRKTYVRHRLQPAATSQVHLLERLSLQMPDIQAPWHFLQTVFFLFIWFSVKPKIRDIEFTLESW